jgi:drug/metabolite transporter (DMT)-like permease
MEARETLSARTRVVALTALTLVAFAGNSILCRMALVERAIDPVSFTALRLLGGALVLLPALRSRRPWNARAAVALFAYAIGFSLAYVTLDAGTGALLLFGLVQVTMIGAGLRQGERPTPLRALGMAAAVVGVVLLVLPGVSAPDPIGALLMAVAGVAWGVYSLAGRSVLDPVAATAANFVLAAPLGIAALLVAWIPLGPGRIGGDLVATAPGIGLALASGALTSGLGYVLWYAALRGHSATSAAIVQLLVPVLAALGGVALLEEEPTPRLLYAGVLTLGGVAVTVLAAQAPGRSGR